MSRGLKRGIKYILNGTPEYKINVLTSTCNGLNVLKDNIVCITGGTKGIGFAIARKILSMGGKVIITGRNEEDLIKAKQILGEKCGIIKFDITEVSKMEAFWEEATNIFGKIDSLINNAGISLHEEDFITVDEKNFDIQISTNLKGTYFMCQSFIKYLEQNKIKNSNIINMISETAGQNNYRPYGLTKAAIASFTKWLAQKYILEGIRVNAIAPGVTETSMTNYYTKGKEINENAVGKRVLKPEEIAEVVCFVLSNSSRCIAGQIIACNEANVCFEN